jgi:hypothetical protein
LLIDQRTADPIQLARRTLASTPVSLGLVAPRHREALLEVQQDSHRFPFLVLEEASRLAQRPGTDGVEVLRGHFEALANQYGETLPAPERNDLRARYLALLAMAHTRRLWRGEGLHSPRPSCELALAEHALQQARSALVDGTGRRTVRAAVLEAEAMVAAVQKQNGRACSVLAEAAELLRGEQPPEWRAEILYWRGKLMAARRLRSNGEAVAVLREALATLGGVHSPTEPVLRLAVIHQLTLAETEEQLGGSDAGVLARAAARLRAAGELYEWFSTPVMRGQRAVMEGRILLLAGDLGGAQAAFAAANAIFADQDATFEAAQLLADVVLCCLDANGPAGLGPAFCRGIWQFPAQRDFFDRVVDVAVRRLTWRLPFDCHGRVMAFLAEVRTLPNGSGAVASCAGRSAAQEDRARRLGRERFRTLVRWKSRQIKAGNDGRSPTRAAHRTWGDQR